MPFGRRTMLATMGLGVAALLGSPQIEAFPLRVLAASDLRVEPRVSGDGRSLTLRVRLLDDRGQPLVGRVVRTELHAEPRWSNEASLRTNALGEAQLEVALAGVPRRIEVRAAFAGDGAASSATTARTLDLDAPFVTADLVLPPEGIELGAQGGVATVTVSIGEVVARSAGGLPVALMLVEGEGRTRLLSAGVTDNSGRAELALEPEALGGAGVFSLLPRVELGPGRVVDGSTRSLLVRARVALGLARAADTGEGVVLVASLLTLPRRPLGDAPLRLQAGERVIAGGRTDARGAARFVLPWSLFRDGSLRVKAVFDPPSPWLTATESDTLTVVLEGAATVRWWWAASALGAACAMLGLVQFQAARKRAKEKPFEPPPPAPAVVVNDRVERVVVQGMRGVEAVFTVLDRATGETVEGAELSVDDGPWHALSEMGALHTMPVVQRVTYRVRAPGYAPRVVPGEFARPGRYRFQVSLRSWREELHEQVRGHLGRAPGGGALRTPREAFAKRADPAANELLPLLEAGCYGPGHPGEAESEAVSSHLGRMQSEALPEAPGDAGRH